MMIDDSNSLKSTVFNHCERLVTLLCLENEKGKKITGANPSAFRQFSTVRMASSLSNDHLNTVLFIIDFQKSSKILAIKPKS